MSAATPPLGGRLPEGRCAGLLVVDMTAGFIDPSSPLACDAQGPLVAIEVLLDAAREAGRPTAYTRVAYEDPISGAAELFQAKVPALAALREGTAWTRIDERIAPRPGEWVLTKELASAFAGTPLVEWVAMHGLDSLVVVGASTSGCVRATVVDALQHGLRAFVPREAVADRDRQAHEASLRDIDGRYGDVVELGQALALLRQVSVPSGGSR